MKHRNGCALFIAAVILLSVSAMPHMADNTSSRHSFFAPVDVSRDSLTNDNVNSECAFGKIRISPFSFKKGKTDFLIPYENAHILIQSAFSVFLKNADFPADKLTTNINSRAP